MSSTTYNSTQSKKPLLSTMKLLVLLSSVLASATVSSGLQVVSTAPSLPSVKSHHNRPSNSQLHYTINTADIPASARTPAFEESVRKLVVKKKTHDDDSTSTTSSTNSWSHLPNMMDVRNLQEFEQATTATNRVTVVRFHAPYCRACKAMAPQLEHLAKAHPEIQFVQVSYNQQDAALKEIIHAQGIRKVPHGQVYVPGFGRVEEANFSKRYFKDVAHIIESYAQGECALPEDVNEYSHTFESPYATLRGQR